MLCEVAVNICKQDKTGYLASYYIANQIKPHPTAITNRMLAHLYLDEKVTGHMTV